MSVSYKPLWKTLVEREWNKQRLREETGLSACTMAKLGKNQNVTTGVLLRVCEALECTISDVVEITKLGEIPSEILQPIVKPRVVSLFSGAGGLDLGFKEAGFRLVWANDFDADAVATYRDNIGTECVLGDISQIASNEIPDCEVMIGGFPCQGFSVANTRRDVLDSRNKLYLEYIRILSEKKPLMFVAENVKGILTLGKGAVIRAIINDFTEAGYTVVYKLLNAADYGVPQLRQRIIIVGIRNDLNLNFSFPEPTHSKGGEFGLLPWVSVAEALKDIPDPDGNQANKVPNNQYSRYKIVTRNFTGHRPTDGDKPSPTILARGNGGGGVCAIPHYNGTRRLSIRESATIQTFPKEFIFSGRMGSAYRQVGNAVPVVLAKVIAVQVMKTLRKKDCPSNALSKIHTQKTI